MYCYGVKFDEKSCPLERQSLESFAAALERLTHLGTGTPYLRAVLSFLQCVILSSHPEKIS